MIQLNNFSYAYPQKELYNDISFVLEEGQHCAFIGSSGSGKSTLVSIIMDPENYMYDGKLEVEQPCRFGYVSQFVDFGLDGDKTVFEYLAYEYISKQEEIETICDAMATAEDLEPLMEQYQNAMDAFSAIGGDDYESRIMKQLSLANLDRHKDLAVSKLSGGEFKLIHIIREMLVRPDVMVMDEPDVFLDFENQNGLKNLINNHKGILLVITHSRFLLTDCFNKILHLENKLIQEFDGSYIEYNFALLQKKIEIQELAVADRLEIERNEEVIERLRNTATVNSEAARGRTLMARVKIQERLIARQIQAPFVDIHKPNIRFVDRITPEETTLLEVKNYEVGYESILLENVEFEIKTGEKVALIGANGTGKTTLFRDLFRHEKESIFMNEDTSIAYLSQVQGEVLDEDKTIFDLFFDINFPTYQTIIDFLSDYGFTEEMMKQPIRSLSGGEKNLLQIALATTKETDLLLLDEPTSHLDTYAQMALEEGINNYKGSVLLISHDLYTILHCMDYVLLIEDKTIRKVKLKKFKRMVYGELFNRDAVELEEKIKTLETKIAVCLQAEDFEAAKGLSEELEILIAG